VVPLRERWRLRGRTREEPVRLALQLPALLHREGMEVAIPRRHWHAGAHVAGDGCEEVVVFVLTAGRPARPVDTLLLGFDLGCGHSSGGISLLHHHLLRLFRLLQDRMHCGCVRLRLSDGDDVHSSVWT